MSKEWNQQNKEQRNPQQAHGHKGQNKQAQGQSQGQQRQNPAGQQRNK